MPRSAEDFCGWLVARGKDVYIRALARPQSVAASLVDEFYAGEETVGIDIRYEAESVFHERNGTELEVHVDPCFDLCDSEEYRPLLEQGRGQ